MEKIDPKDYPFRHHIEANKHLDTDEDRHKIKTIVETIDVHYKGKEHLFCDKEQLNASGKFRRPKILQEATAAGYNSVVEYYEAKMKEKENSKQEEINQLKEYIKQQNEVLKQIIEKLK